MTVLWEAVNCRWHEVLVTLIAHAIFCWESLRLLFSSGLKCRRLRLPFRSGRLTVWMPIASSMFMFLLLRQLACRTLFVPGHCLYRLTPNVLVLFVNRVAQDLVRWCHELITR